MVEKVSKVLWIVVATVFAVTAAATTVVHGPEARCYFVFGDSVFDNGNNNALNTTAKVNYLPYGIDYPEGPTGRFSNGRIIPDVIAELAGFNDTIPPFAGASPAQANIGLNYASGGGGIREETSQNLGERISLRRQINNHLSAIINAAVPRSQLLRCLYTINIGSNDYLNNYFLQPTTPARRQYTPDEFAESLIRLYNIYLKQLYLLGARNVALFGIGKIGCIPRIVATLGGGVGCAEEVNQAVDLFNNKLKALVTDFNNKLSSAKFTYVDLFSGNAEDFAALGVTVGDRSCCTVNPGEELCAQNRPICPDRTKYIFWDNVHTTDIINTVIAIASFNGNITSPFSISQLVN
ncbi:GDSL esterase/lipase [Raphanus sativus]|uniref:GDSL esterase/lipase At4g30140-like n=1 Tax=Raphanus sativus TaxID=3726 RepID=A0A6J0LY57_RAPSA|nr:GDSL esterase/lipase At4g30140-like [Raphanus sativus]KAJ4880538.1 GDSL esterase/lipase [Raphanus sativus]